MKPKKNALEWLVFGLSTVIVVAVVVILVLAGMKSGDEPPILEIEVGTPMKTGDAFRVPVRVRNAGDETAVEARIEVALMSGADVVERGELAIAFVPRKSTREGWVTFRRDPRCCEIVTRAAGFNKP